MIDGSGLTAPVDTGALLARLGDLRAQYQAADPWPHVVIDGLFPDDLIDQVAAEIRGSDRSHMATAETRTMVKRELAEVDLMGPATRSVLAALDSDDFVSFVSALTGVDDLRADPMHHWAGVHETAPGGFTMVHTDFRAHPVTQLHHRTNVLLYLNRGWQPEWGGELELWNEAVDRLGKRIVPVANRMVIFETNARSMHGLPNPVAPPDGRSRISIAAYQYSPHPAQEVSRRVAKYARRPGDDWRVGLPTWWDVKERIPAPVRQAAKKLRSASRRLASRR